LDSVILPKSAWDCLRKLPATPTTKKVPHEAVTSILPTIREVPLSDHQEDVIELWRRNLSGAARGDARRKMQAGYLDNPAGAGRGLLLHNGNDDVAVGVICLHPRRLHLGSRVVDANNLADFAVDTGYRTLGPALMLMKRAVALAGSAESLLYALPNQKSAAVCKRAGLGAMGELSRYARVVSGRHPLVAKWSRALRPISAPLATMALTVFDGFRSLRLRPMLRYESAAFDDPAIDILWARRSRELLLNERTSTMLRWRYNRATTDTWQLCLARDATGDVAGTVVWRLRDGIAEVSDFFSTTPARLTATLLHGFSRHARGAGAHGVSLEFFGQSDVVRELNRAGFKVRSEPTPVVVGILPPTLAELRDRERWYLTSFDNDAD
jgi:hypothetical protein